MTSTFENINKCIEETSKILKVPKKYVIDVMNNNKQFKDIKKDYYSLKEISILRKTNVEWSRFRGYPINELLIILYILEKYKNICVPLEQVKEVFDHGVYSLIWTCIFDKDGICKRTLNLPENFNKIFEICLNNKKIKFIIIPLSLRYFDNKILDAHSNYLIYDRFLNTIERFEPHGVIFGYNSLKLDTHLKGLFDKWKIKYISPLFFCPVSGFQYIEALEGNIDTRDPGGFCNAWTIYWTTLRLENPRIPRKILIEKAIKQINTNFRQFIRGYSHFLMDKKDEMMGDLPKDTLIYTPEGMVRINPLRHQIFLDHINKKISDFFAKLN